MSGLEELAFFRSQEFYDDIGQKYGYINERCDVMEKELKAFQIIKEYQVDVWLLKQCDYENYIRIRKKAMVSIGQIVNENGTILEDEITKEEFDILKEML